jgi:ribonuclease HI
MYFDGSLMKTSTGAGLVFISPLGVRMRYMIRLHFATSNNIAEYKALVNGLHIATKLGIQCLDVRGDSQLIVELPRPQNGSLLQDGVAFGGQVRWPRAQSHRTQIQ